MIYQDDPSVKKWYHRPKVIKILLFSVVFIITAVLFFMLKKPQKIEDHSNGVFSATFETTHRPLQKELELLNGEGFFEKTPDRMVPLEFTEWYSAPETKLIISEKNFSPEEYSLLIRRSLQAGLAKKNIVFGKPLENPVPGDLYRTLLGCFNWYLRREDWRSCIESLDQMFCYSALLLCSNAADIYFLSKSVETGKLFEEVFAGNAEASRSWHEMKRSLLGKYFFTMHGIYQIERLRMCHDFEKIRVHGISLIERKNTGGVIFQEGFANGSFSQMWDGLSTSFVDAFYDVDRDQTMTLIMLRQLLNDGFSISMIKRPNRKMSIHCYRRLAKDSEILSKALHYMDKE